MRSRLAIGLVAVGGLTAAVALRDPPRHGAQPAPQPSAPAEAAVPQPYRKPYLPFDDQTYPAPIFTPETWTQPPADFQAYVNPEDFYAGLHARRPLAQDHTDIDREQCLDCHAAEGSVARGGSYALWIESAHAHADPRRLEQMVAQARLLADGRFDDFCEAAGIPRWFVDELVPGMERVGERYRQAVVETQGIDLARLVGPDSPLLDEATGTYSISCADCHVRPGADVSGAEPPGITLPTTVTCAVCHPRQWVELMSELTVTTPPYPPGRPSHAAGWISNIAPPWYASVSRTKQWGCDSCHNTEVRGCDSCHSRHAFRPQMARDPMVCKRCHTGPDHPDYESWEASKHGYIFEKSEPHLGVPLERAVEGVDYEAPSCQMCHMRYSGRAGNPPYVSHNMVATAIWRMGTAYHDPSGQWMGDPEAPLDMRVALGRAVERGVTPAGFEARRDQWVALCAACHSPRFSRVQLDAMDTLLVETNEELIATRRQIQALWDEQMIVGQRLGVRGLDTVREHFPQVEWTLDYPAGLWRWFHRAPYTGSAVERRFLEQWFRWTPHVYKGMAHMAPDYQFHLGTAQMWREQQNIDEEELRLRILRRTEERLEELERQTGARAPDLSRPYWTREEDP